MEIIFFLQKCRAQMPPNRTFSFHIGVMAYKVLHMDNLQNTWQISYVYLQTNRIIYDRQKTIALQLKVFQNKLFNILSIEGNKELNWIE